MANRLIEIQNEISHMYLTNIEYRKFQEYMFKFHNLFEEFRKDKKNLRVFMKKRTISSSAH